MESTIVQPTGLELRTQLLHRRDRLETVLAEAPDPRPLARLLAEVDATLDRIDRGKFGLCDVCHDTVEPGRILVDLMTLDSGEAVFLVGDVSGKGLASSLLMAHLHAIVRSLIALRLPFAELL